MTFFVEKNGNKAAFLQKVYGNRLAESVEAVSENRNMTAVVYEDSVYLQARDEIADEDVYVLSEDNEKLRVLTENGSVVRIG